MRKTLHQRLLVLAALAFVACTLESEGQIATEPDASTGGSGGSSGTSPSDSGWGDSASGGASGGGGQTDAAAGTSGASGTAGSGQCLADTKKCSAPTECCSGICGKGADTLDCNTAGECVACNDDAQCPNTGRCDGCQCVDLELVGGSCDEPSDCLSGQCGAPAAADDADCNDSSHCIGCDDDAKCPTNMRCEQCECSNKVGFGAACNEPTDCISDLCGKGEADANDCNLNDKCVDCRGETDCSSTQACEDCQCVAKLGVGENCDEPSDCTSGTCSGGKCK